MIRKISGLIILGLLLFCSMSANAQKSRTLLLECQENGGLTPKGGAFVKMRIGRDGTVQFENNDGKKTKRLSKPDLALLAKEVDTADYAAITATKSGKMSPAAYDGTETTYIFYGKGQRQEVAPYKYVVPPKTTLFKTVETIRKRYKL